MCCVDRAGIFFSLTAEDLCSDTRITACGGERGGGAAAGKREVESAQESSAR